MKSPRSWRPEEIKVGMYYTFCCLRDAEQITDENIDYVKSELEDPEEVYIDVYATLDDLIKDTEGCDTPITRPLARQ